MGGSKSRRAGFALPYSIKHDPIAHRFQTCPSISHMIEVERLRRTYGSVAAVDGLSFTAQPGEIFGLRARRFPFE